MDDAVLAGLAGVVASGVVWLVARRVAALRASWRAKYRARRAMARQRDAEGLLRAAGYRIVQTQARRQYRIRRDGRAFDVDLRADLIVRRDGRRWVADVKTGQQAPHLTTAATRRQLLEYRVAYDVDGVLLVDMEAGAIHAVDFEIGEGRRRAVGALLPFALGVIAGALVAAWLAGALGARESFTFRGPSALQEGRGE